MSEQSIEHQVNCTAPCSVCGRNPKACPHCGHIENFKAMTEGMPEDYYYCWDCEKEFI